MGCLVTFCPPNWLVLVSYDCCGKASVTLTAPFLTNRWKQDPRTLLLHVHYVGMVRSHCVCWMSAGNQMQVVYIHGRPRTNRLLQNSKPDHLSAQDRHKECLQFRFSQHSRAMGWASLSKNNGNKQAWQQRDSSMAGQHSLIRREGPWIPLSKFLFQ